MNVVLNKKKLIFSIKIFIILLVGLIIFLYLNRQYSFAIPCFFHKVTGFYCPGCGITRMFLSLLHLDFYQAFRFNPYLFILLPFFTGYGMIYYYHYVTDKKEPHVPSTIWNILLGSAIIFMILRNIPFFSFLAPTFLS